MLVLSLSHSAYSTHSKSMVDKLSTVIFVTTDNFKFEVVQNING